MAKLALPGGTTPSAIGLFLAPPDPVAIDVEQVVDQAHDQLGDEHGDRADHDLAGRPAGERDQRADHHGEGQRLARVDRPRQANGSVPVPVVPSGRPASSWVEVLSMAAPRRERFGQQPARRQPLRGT